MRARLGAWGGCLRLGGLLRICGLVVLAVTPPAAASMPTEPIKIGTTQSALLLWLAEEKGFFRAHGLDVSLRMLSSGRHAADALLNGDVDMSMASDSVVANKAFEFSDIRVVASISTSRTARLVARGDRNIARPADLAGKRVGVTLATVGEYFLARYLALHHVAVPPVIVDLKPEQIAQGLVDGTIDAGLSWEPFITDAESELKGNSVLLPEQIDQLYYLLLATRADWAQKHPDAVKAVLEAIIDAEAFASRDPAGAKQIIQKKFGYRTEQIEQLWPLHNLHVSLPQALLFNLELQANWQIRKQLTKVSTPPQFLDLILTAPLEHIRASSVEIVK
jgi:NitT/TauT family transport system substrate-binding protein